MVEVLALLALMFAAATVFRRVLPLCISAGQSFNVRRQAGTTWSFPLRVLLESVFDGRWSALSAVLARPAPLAAAHAPSACTPPPRARTPLGSPPGRLLGAWAVDAVPAGRGRPRRN